MRAIIASDYLTTISYFVKFVKKSSAVNVDEPRAVV
jgi:hypothetical protein